MQVLKPYWTIRCYRTRLLQALQPMDLLQNTHFLKILFLSRGFHNLKLGYHRNTNYIISVPWLKSARSILHLGREEIHSLQLISYSYLLKFCIQFYLWISKHQDMLSILHHCLILLERVISTCWYLLHPTYFRDYYQYQYLLHVVYVKQTTQ